MAATIIGVDFLLEAVKDRSQWIYGVRAGGIFLF